MMPTIHRTDMRDRKEAMVLSAEMYSAVHTPIELTSRSLTFIVHWS